MPIPSFSTVHHREFNGHVQRTVIIAPLVTIRGARHSPLIAVVVFCFHVGCCSKILQYRENMSLLCSACPPD